MTQLLSNFITISNKYNKNVIKIWKKIRLFNCKAPIHNFSYLNHPQQQQKRNLLQKHFFLFDASLWNILAAQFSIISLRSTTKASFCANPLLNCYNKSNKKGKKLSKNGRDTHSSNFFSLLSWRLLYIVELWFCHHS